LSFSLAASIITITVSIAIQSVKTSEKFVKKFNDNPIIFNTRNVTKNDNGINKEAKIDSRNQTKIKIVTKTKTKV
jgi:hypothetical protein